MALFAALKNKRLIGETTLSNWWEAYPAVSADDNGIQALLSETEPDQAAPADDNPAQIAENQEGKWWEAYPAMRADVGHQWLLPDSEADKKSQEGQAVLSDIEADKKFQEGQARLHEAHQSIESYGEAATVAGQVVTDTTSLVWRLFGQNEHADNLNRDSDILTQAMGERDAARWQSKADPEGMSTLEQAGQYVPFLKQGVRGAARSLGTAVLGAKGAGALFGTARIAAGGARGAAAGAAARGAAGVAEGAAQGAGAAARGALGAAGGSAYGAIGLASAQEANNAMTEGTDAGLEGSALAGYVASQGLIEALPATVMQRLGLGGVEAMIAGPAIRGGIKAGFIEAIKATGKEIPEELVTEVLHAVAREYSNVDPHALDSDRLSSLIADTVLSTVIMGAGAGAVKGAQGIVEADRGTGLSAQAQRLAPVVPGQQPTGVPSRTQQVDPLAVVATLQALASDGTTATTPLPNGATPPATGKPSTEAPTVEQKLAALDKPPGAHKWAEITFGDRSRYKEAPDEKTRTQQWQQSRATPATPAPPALPGRPSAVPPPSSAPQGATRRWWDFGTGEPIEPEAQLELPTTGKPPLPTTGKPPLPKGATDKRQVQPAQVQGDTAQGSQVPGQPQDGTQQTGKVPEAKVPVVTPTGKAPWQLTRDQHVAERERRINEFRRLSDENGGGPSAMQVPEVAEAFRAQEEWSDLDMGHKPRVQQAIKEGKQVPPEVLAEYPGVSPAPKPAAATQPQATTAPTTETKPPTQDTRDVVKGTDGKLYREDPDPNLKPSQRIKMRQAIDPSEGIVLITKDQFGNPIPPETLKARQEFVDKAKPGAKFESKEYPGQSFEVMDDGTLLNSSRRKMGDVQTQANLVKPGDLTWTAEQVEPSTAAAPSTEKQLQLTDKDGKVIKPTASQSEPTKASADQKATKPLPEGAIGWQPAPPDAFSVTEDSDLKRETSRRQKEDPQRRVVDLVDTCLLYTSPSPRD